ncbi:hypothetical protein Tco_1268584, partial [Tanacetum coccineum]
KPLGPRALSQPQSHTASLISKVVKGQSRNRTSSLDRCLKRFLVKDGLVWFTSLNLLSKSMILKCSRSVSDLTYVFLEMISESVRKDTSAFASNASILFRRAREAELSFLLPFDARL